MSKALRILLSILLLPSIFSCTSKEVKSYNKGINIIPAPLALELKEGSFILNKNTSFNATTPQALKVANFFSNKIATSTGYTLEIGDKAIDSGINLLIDENLDLKDEGYILEVNPTAVNIKSKTENGLFYGMQSFMQLLPAEIESKSKVKNIEWKAQSVLIKDEPRFDYRGFMLDPCRHFIPVEEVKKNIDVLSLYKINKMHFHLTEDQGWRIEIKKYPKLTQIGSKRIDYDGTEYGGFYTQEEIKEIVAYAAERYITVIPEFEIPGHELAAISAYPELSCTGENVTPRIMWGVEDVVMCPGKESTFTFIQDVINEMVQLFPGEYFHIGGDECPKVRWEKCPACQALIKREGLKKDSKHTAEQKLQSYVVKVVEDMLAKHGKKLIGWDEILEGGLSPDATVMSWRGIEGGIEAAMQKHEAIMTPYIDGMYLDFYQGDSKIEPVAIGGYSPLIKTYSYNPVPDTLLNMGLDKYIKGVQCNNWSEYMYSSDIMEYRMYPRMLALSEVAWSSLENKNYDDFLRRLDNSMVRLDNHDINYHIPLPEQPNGSCNFIAFTDEVKVEFKTTRPIKMLYTIDGSEPNLNSKEYTEPLSFTEDATIKICSVLPSGKMSTIRTITIDKQTYAPAIEVENAKNGLKLKATHGKFVTASELDDVTEWENKIVGSLHDLCLQSNSKDNNNFASVAEGYFYIPEDGVYYFSSDNDEVWIDGKLFIENTGEVKRYSRKDKSIALEKGYHELKTIFVSNVIGGYPSIWSNGQVNIRRSDEANFNPIAPSQLFYADK